MDRAQLALNRSLAARAPGAAFARVTAAVLALTLGVILFGAVVRITGSGAGCGQHWPSCQGEIVHLPQTLETVIEYTHRITSGASALCVFALTFAAFRRFPRQHGVRRALVVASAFMIVEALIGAALVRFALVGDDASLARTIIMPLHLVSTSALLGALTLAARWSVPVPPPVRPVNPVDRRNVTLALIGVVLVSGTGAVTALGDTVYPVRSGSALEQLSASSGSLHLLEVLRSVHPLLAVIVTALLLMLLSSVAGRAPSRAAERFARHASWLVLVQVGAGVLNVLLSAPGYLQIVHLLLASLLWIALVLLAAELREAPGLLSPAATRRGTAG